MANQRDLMPALTGGAICDCGERTVRMRGVAVENALDSVAFVFAKRGEIELTYANQWRCPQCAKRPAFWAITDLTEDE